MANAMEYRLDNLIIGVQNIIASLPLTCACFKSTLMVLNESRQKWIEEKQSLSSKLEERTKKLFELKQELSNTRQQLDKEKLNRAQVLAQANTLATQLEVLKKVSNVPSSSKEARDAMKLLQQCLSDQSSGSDKLQLFTESDTDIESAALNKGATEEPPEEMHYKESVPTELKNSRGSIVDSQPDLPPLGDVHTRTMTPSSLSNCEEQFKNHVFVKKQISKGESVCCVCSKKIRFTPLGTKCKDCSIIVHVRCKGKAVLPCVPLHVRR